MENELNGQYPWNLHKPNLLTVSKFKSQVHKVVELTIKCYCYWSSRMLVLKCTHFEISLVTNVKLFFIK